METKNVIFDLRTKMGLSQEELAEKVFVTRQAVSRWETGETTPNTETLKLLSSLFDVSINTLLGSPRKLFCECCGMEIDDASIGREKNGRLNEDFCKWCYADGEYTLDIWRKYASLCGKEKLLEFKRGLIGEINALLRLEGLPEVMDLNVLPGEFINMEYTLTNGERVKLLDDKVAYLGSQIEWETGKCIGIAANTSLILICSYEKNGVNPQIIIYKSR